MRKQTTRKPERREEKARKRKPANPRAMAMSDWMQKASDDVHVSDPFSVLASAVAADSADMSMYANTCITVISYLYFQLIAFFRPHILVHKS